MDHGRALNWPILHAGIPPYSACEKMVIVTVLMAILCIWTRSVDTSRISCPQQFVCKCESIKLYPRQAVIENRINCTERGLQEVPDLSPTHGAPISEMLLAHNQITSIPNGTFKDIRLINANSLSLVPNLDLSYNPLGHLAGSELDGLLANELRLMFNNCSLTLWPALPGSVTAVTIEIYLKDNMLLAFPRGGMAEYRRLKVLDVSGNKHMSLVKGSLDGIDDVLEVLYLEAMELSSIPTGVLHSLKALKFLYLRENHITHIPDFAFHGFKSTDLIVDLTNNSVVQVGKDALRQHPNTTPGLKTTSLTIKTLFLDVNELSDLDFLADPCSLVFGNQSTISVRNNPIKCDCFLYNLTRLRVVEVHGTCGSPGRYSGTKLDSYLNSDFQNVLEQTDGVALESLPGFSPNTQMFSASSALGSPRRRQRRGSFLQEAQTECNGGKDELLHQQFVCACRKWKPYSLTAKFHPSGPQLAAQTQSCAKAAAACLCISYGNFCKYLLTIVILLNAAKHM